MAARSGTGVRARIGCSGWSYPAWRDAVYPADLPRRAWFDHYVTLFDAVELNTTFYRLPTADAVARWRAAAPDDFVFALKLGAFGSHRMKLRDAASWLPNHVERARILGPKLGPTLIQMPPRWKRDEQRLDDMLSEAPGDMAWAVELRERSWLCDEVFEVLARHGAALCIHDLLDDHPFELTAGWTYVRRHGPAATVHPYQGRYGAERLEPLARRFDELLEEGVAVHCYFNNDEAGHAVRDATWMANRLGRPVPGRDETP